MLRLTTSKRTHGSSDFQKPGSAFNRLARDACGQSNMEMSMTKALMALASASAVALATPAMSQSMNSNVGLRIDRIQADIQAGVQNGTITRAEAQPLREQYRQL